MTYENEIRHLELCAANYGAIKHVDPKVQLKNLTDTLEHLVKAHGDEGVFYVNDLDGKDTCFASEFLDDYTRAQGYTGIQIVAMPGSYLDLVPPKVKTMHLKHPDTTTLSFRNLRQLQRLASFSESGLELTIWRPWTVKNAFRNRGLESTYLGDGFLYTDPKGITLGCETGKLRIHPNTEFVPEGWWKHFQDIIDLKRNFAQAIVVGGILKGTKSY